MAHTWITNSPVIPHLSDEQEYRTGSECPSRVSVISREGGPSEWKPCNFSHYAVENSQR